MSGPGGIHLHLIDGLVVANNVLDGVDGPGISGDECTDAVLTGNAIRNTRGPGIEPEGSDRVIVGQNRIGGSSEWAIACRGGKSGTAELQISDNRCSGGVALEGEIDRYLVTGNLLGGSVENDAVGAGQLAHHLD